MRLRFRSDKVFDHLAGPTPPSALTLLELLHQRNNYPRPNQSAQNHLLAAIIDELHKPSTPALNKIEQDRNLLFTQWIQQALRGDSNINQGAEELAISPDHFCRLFKKQYGQSPKSYIMNQRFEQAITILSEENISTNALAKRVGLNDSALFCKQFKQRFGCSPQDYKA